MFYVNHGSKSGVLNDVHKWSQTRVTHFQWIQHFKTKMAKTPMLIGNYEMINEFARIPSCVGQPTQLVANLSL